MRLLPALAVALLAAPLARAQPLDLAPGEVQALALDALQDGRWTEAASWATALLARDPADATATLILAQSAYQSGDLVTAGEAARRLYAADVPAEQRYDAARLAALAAANEGRILAAQWWLRRALIHAPTPEERERTNRDAAALRQLTPWQTDAELSIAPSDNVNGGASSELNFIDGIPFVGILSPDAQALSGWVGSAQIRTRYTLAEDRTARTTLAFRAWGRAVALSDEAREFLDANTDPGEERIEARDFSSALIELSFGHERLAGNGFWTFGGDVGRTWASGEPNYDYVRLSIGRSFILGERNRLQVTTFGEDRLYPDTGGDRELRYGLNLSLTHQFVTGAAVNGLVGWRRSEADNFNANSESWTAQIGYAPADPIGPARLSASLGAQWTDYPDYVVGFFAVPGGRQDVRTYARLEATFDDWSYAGFAPVVTIDAERTESNVSRFETEGLTLGLTFRSTF